MADKLSQYADTLAKVKQQAELNELFDVLAESYLNFPKDTKLKHLREALESEDMRKFITLSKILLDAPISKGGIATEEIERVRQQYIHKI